MKGIPYRYGIETLPINRNRNVKHKTETETERTPKKKEKKKLETPAFGGASRCFLFDRKLSIIVQVEMLQGAYEGCLHGRKRHSFSRGSPIYLISRRGGKQPFTDFLPVVTRGARR